MAEMDDILESENIILVDEEGEEHTFIMLDVIEVDGGEYAILQPLDEDVDEEEAEAVILKIDKDENGEEILTDIEDDDEWEKVADAWQDAMEAEAEE
ncbi:MAG: DUF1292 domain-containing protein [Clostridiales bacterium]|nr:DUF1292 domain-containing protein [Clostridiales bacterium]